MRSEATDRCAILLHILALGGLLLGAAGRANAQGTVPVAGRYDFEAVSVEGTPFTGTALVRGTAEHGYEGILFSTIRPPGTLLLAEREGDRVRLLFDLGGPRPVFELQLRENRFEGRWLLGDREGPMSGVYEPGARVDVEPQQCVLAGVEDVSRCGILHVPEDPALPAGRWIPLNVAILPSAATPPAGALFHFAGGPGQAATEQAAGNAARFARIRRTRDVVMIDQRGTGNSNPLTCDWGGAEATARAILAWDLPVQKVAACAERLRRKADLRLYTTRHAAEDVEAVRRWLDYGRIDLYGGSYGSRAALEYVRRHPSAVRTMTLRGVMPPGASMSVENPRRVDAELERVFTQCAADSGCDELFPDLRGKLARLRGRLAERPIALAVADPRSGDTVRVTMDEAALGGSLRRLLMSEESRGLVPRAITSPHAGDWSDLAAGVVGTLAVSGSLYFGMAFSVSCAEEVVFTEARDWEGETRGTLMGSGPAGALMDACSVWDRLPPDPGALEPVRLEAPALFFSGEYDPATPPEWGERAAAAAAEGAHVVLPGGSHTTFTDCALRIMAAFVDAGTIEGLDMACAAERRASSFARPTRESLE